MEILWLLLAPVYALLTTLRHEASHALAGVWFGAEVSEFAFWPTAVGWGHVRFDSEVPWPVYGAPYVVNVAVFLVAAWVCVRIPIRLRQLWINVVILGLVSPLVDSAYNYVKAFVRGGDIAALFQVLPWYLVHLWFIGFLLGALWVGWKVVLRSPARFTT